MGQRQLPLPHTRHACNIYTMVGAFDLMSSLDTISICIAQIIDHCDITLVIVIYGKEASFLEKRIVSSLPK